MNLLLAHLNLTLIQAHGLITGRGRHEGGDGDVIDPTTTAPHPRSGGGSGGGLFDYFMRSGVRGAGWSMGSRLMHMLPIPVLIGLAVSSESSTSRGGGGDEPTPVDPFRIGPCGRGSPAIPRWCAAALPQPYGWRV
jgi:hypothetical protein